MPWVPDAGRVVTGSAGGLRLAAPGSGTRPLSDRVKQALFALVEAERPDAWGHALLDLFAGSGAAGIEALSRGAPQVVLVERDRRAAAVIRENLARTGLAARARVVPRDVAGFLASPARQTPEAPFGSVVIDPPYEQDAALLASLEHLGDASAGWLDGSAVVVAKHFWRTALPERSGDLELTRGRRFGETALSVYRRRRDPAAGGS
jgi:16S rRNA (guanine966-N2)-methyltransferase